jgi:putative restriction endonuclease
MKAHAETGARLVNQAKGIYKPAYTDFALSVRTIQDGPYPDKEVEYRSDGTWVCQYFQENADPSKRDHEATNRGLMRCMQENVPVGFLIKRKPKPGVEYDVLGLGFVISWADGYFTIEGANSEGETHERPDAPRARASQGVASAPDTDFDTENDADLRQKQITTVAVRRGQASFRASLLSAYEGRCCITECDLVDALEAAHISPYRGSQSNHPQNGLLLRADIHTLFDLGLMAVDQDKKLVLAPPLALSQAYSSLTGMTLREPSDRRLAPSREALRKHREWSGL